MARRVLCLVLAGLLHCTGSKVIAAEGSSGDDDLPDGYVDTPGTAARVAVVGNLAYVADRLAGLQIVDISSPARPRIIGSVGSWTSNTCNPPKTARYT